MPEGARRGGRRWREVTVRWALALGAIALAVAAVLNYRAYLAGAREVERLLAEAGLAARQGDLAERIRREPDPLMGRLQVARALIAETLDPSSFASLPAREAALEAGRVGERLELAETIAAEATVARPVVWQGWMILGAARYLQWSRAGDSRLATDRDAWREPLERARHLAPQESEPVAFIVAAGLELWPVLDERGRAEVLSNLQEALRDPETFYRLLPTWLTVAPDEVAAFAFLPDRPETWREVRRIATASTNWELFLAADVRLLSALGREVEGRLVEAAARLRGGDDSGARALVLGTIAELPVNGRFADGFQRLLELAPPGPTGVAGVPSLRRWLQWSTDLFVRGKPGLTPAAVARLLTMIAGLPDAERALAEVAAGDLAAAELLERRSEELGLEGWAPYCIAKARVLARQREFAAAWRSVRAAHRSWRGTGPDLAARQALAGAAGEEAVRLEIDSEIARLAAARWPATAWYWRSGRAFLDLWCTAPARGVDLTIDLAPVAGSIIQCSVDGRSLGSFVARPGARLAMPVGFEAGFHLVEVETIAGGRVAPGEVLLTSR